MCLSLSHAACGPAVCSVTKSLSEATLVLAPNKDSPETEAWLAQTLAGAGLPAAKRKEAAARLRALLGAGKVVSPTWLFDTLDTGIEVGDAAQYVVAAPEEAKA